MIPPLSPRLMAALRGMPLTDIILAKDQVWLKHWGSVHVPVMGPKATYRWVRMTPSECERYYARASDDARQWQRRAVKDLLTVVHRMERLVLWHRPWLTSIHAMDATLTHFLHQMEHHGDHPTHG